MSDGEHSLVKNAASEKQIKKAVSKEKLAAQRVVDDWTAVLELEQGRRVISQLLAQFKIAQLEWKAGAEINRNVGIYECANHILAQVIRIDPELGAKMLAEAYKTEIDNGNL